MLKELLQAGNKRRKRPTEKPETIEKRVIGSYILIITLNVNVLNAPTKRHTDWVDENMHVCTSTYHIILLDPPNCIIILYCEVNHVSFPLWLAIVIIFCFLSGY